MEDENKPQAEVKVNGRPRIELENIQFNGWKQLDALIIWSNEQFCADQLGMSVDTLYRRIKEHTGLTFAEYKAQKMELVKTNLRKKQYDVAMAGNVSMLIWLGKNQLDQSDKNEVTQNIQPITITYEKDES